MSQSLPPEFDAFIQARIASGAYSSEREVLQKAFDLLEKRESLLAHIDEARTQLGLGQYSEYDENDRDKFIADIARSSTRVKPPGQSP